MSEFLSQEEINALLKGLSTTDINIADSGNLSDEEQDILGEIGNISFGTSATTLYTLLNNKVTITTPKVSVIKWEDLKKEFNIPYVAVDVEYTEGIKGRNLLILKEEDVIKITDLMMGGTGNVEIGEITELHLSAISEAMNQMIGSASTSLATLLNKSINISPPKAFIVDFATYLPDDIAFSTDKVVKVAFKMEVGNIIDSEIMQILPIDFAKELVKSVLSKNVEKIDEPTFQTEDFDDIIEIEEKDGEKEKEGTEKLNNVKADNYNFNERNEDTKKAIKKDIKVDVSPVIFQNFDDDISKHNFEGIDNIDLILDVPLTITVELGKTKKLIKDILELSEGSVIELDKLAGEPVDILANGKYIAKGEVVVIDENFGVRIIDIVNQNKRISNL
ncbi:MAG: flagellar motor switch phosphatase FliY [Thermoanaerobacteraceae bacterium]